MGTRPGLAVEIPEFGWDRCFCPTLTQPVTFGPVDRFVKASAVKQHDVVTSRAMSLEHVKAGAGLRKPQGAIDVSTAKIGIGQLIRP